MQLIPLLAQIGECRRCEQTLPHPPKPVLQVHEQAKILIIGQAPGRLAHQSGVPFSDPSGDRLRAWLGLSRATFYNPEQIAIIPMGFCYPGTGKQGDNPPRPECTQAWHSALLSSLIHIELTLLLGRYAVQAYWPESVSSVTAAVQQWQRFPHQFALPHPSPRNQRWVKQNPWFEAQVLPELKNRIANIIS